MPENQLIYYAHQLDPDFEELLIVPISDLHYGNPLFSEERLTRTLEFLEKHNAYAFLNGDLAEAATKDSVGNIFEQVRSPKQQRDDLTEMLEPYASRFLGATDGNHEYRILRHSDISIVEDIAKVLHIPYRSEGMLHKVSFGSGNGGQGYTNRSSSPWVFWFYQTHGYGGARTKSAKAVKVERVATWIHADFYAMSHDHVVNVAPDVYLLPDPRTNPEKGSKGNLTGFTVGKVTAHRKMLIKTNAYLRWGGYSEQYGFPPTDLATPLIKLLIPTSSYWDELPDKPKQAIKVIV